MALAWMAACGVSFAVGLFVGRQTAPVPFDLHQLERHLLSLREEVVDEKQKALESYFDATSDQTHLTFYDSLKGRPPSQSVPPETAAQAFQAAEAGPEAVKTLRRQAGLKPKTTRRPSMAAVTPNAPGATATSKPPEQGARRKAPPEGPLTIQVAALSRVEDADRMIAKLKTQGFDAYKTMTRVKDRGIRIRIRVGAFPDEAAASGPLRALKEKGYQPMVVPR